MRQSGQKFSKFGHGSAQDWGERVAGFLRGRYPHKTADAVAADLDVSPSTVRKWLELTSTPSLMHVGLMAYAYEEDFLAAIFPGLTCVEAAAAMSRRDAAHRLMAEAEAQLEALAGRRPA